MLQVANTDLLTHQSRKAHNGECQNLQIYPVNAS